jgi:hypothetical protein
VFSGVAWPDMDGRGRYKWYQSESMRIKVNVRSWAHQKFMWHSENLGIGKIRHCAARYWHADARVKFWCCAEK